MYDCTYDHLCFEGKLSWLEYATSLSTSYSQTFSRHNFGLQLLQMIALDQDCYTHTHTICVTAPLLEDGQLLLDRYWQVYRDRLLVTQMNEDTSWKKLPCQLCHGWHWCHDTIWPPITVALAFCFWYSFSFDHIESGSLQHLQVHGPCAAYMAYISKGFIIESTCISSPKFSYSTTFP